MVSVMLYPCIVNNILFVVLCVACLTGFAYCMVKLFALCLGVVAVLLLNVMAVVSVDGGALLDRPCIIF